MDKCTYRTGRMREPPRPRKRNRQMKSDTDWNRTYVRLRQHG